MHAIHDTTHDGFPTLTLAGPDGVRAAFAPAVGMVGCSLRDGEEELLGMRGGLPAYADHGSTFGIPLLHPWANRLAGDRYAVAGRTVTLDPDDPLVHRDGNGLPIHGVLAAAPDWEVVAREAHEERALLRTRLDFGADPRRLAAFPFPHVVELDVVLRGRTLSITTAVTAGPQGPVPIAFGWHPYLAPPGAPRADWEITAPVHERVLLDDRMIPTGAREPARVAVGPLAARTFDDAFCGVVEGTAFSVRAAGRTISVVFGDGYPFAQIYAPPDLDVLCFEPMTAPADVLVSGDALRLVAPGARAAATFSITVA